MDKIVEYRKKHPRCKYCKFKRLVSKGLMIGIPEFWVCDLKDKIIDDTFFWTLKGCFCKWFEPEEGNE